MSSKSFVRHKFDLAVHHDSEAIRCYAEAGNDLLLAHAYNTLSTVHLSAGHGEDAVEAARLSVKHSEKDGDPETIAFNLDCLSSVLINPTIDICMTLDANTLLDTDHGIPYLDLLGREFPLFALPH